jgi:hypothetical protein
LYKGPYASSSNLRTPEGSRAKKWTPYNESNDSTGRALTAAAKSASSGSVVAALSVGAAGVVTGVDVDVDVDANVFMVMLGASTPTGSARIAAVGLQGANAIYSDNQ